MMSTVATPSRCASGIPSIDTRSTALLSDEQHSRDKLCRLLELTRPASTWQTHLIQLLAQQILEDGARKTLAFLQHVLIKGKETLLMSESVGTNTGSCGCLVPVDKRLAPVVIDIDRWKTILVSLGFEIEQPDGYHTLEYVDVLVGEGVLVSALDGMIHLLSLVNSLPWNILRMILTLNAEEAVALGSLAETRGPCLPDQKTAQAFISRYPQEMSQMGFIKQHRMVTKMFTHHSQAHLSKTISLILNAVFEEGPPDIATFV